MRQEAGGSTFGRMNDKPPSGATPGLMHVAAPPARELTDTGRGWMAFAGVMLLLRAAFNAVYGFAALFNDDYLAEESCSTGPSGAGSPLPFLLAGTFAIIALLPKGDTGVGVLAFGLPASGARHSCR
jgi:hypothetical protein